MFSRNKKELLKKLEEQFQLANDTLILQTQALQRNNVLTAQRGYDHMFANIPMYTGDRPEIFEDWLYRLEVASKMSKQPIFEGLMGWSSTPIQKIIESLGTNMPWPKFKDKLRRCISHCKSRVHTSNKLECLRQKGNENLWVFILKCAELHESVMGKKPTDERDPTHIMK